MPAAEALGKETKRGGFNIFKVAGIQITLDYSWFIVFVLVIWSLSAGYFPLRYPGQDPLVYWSVGLVATLFFFASILTHELSHALVAMRAGIKIPAITLFVFGGMSHLSEEAKDPRTEFTIAVVGPLSSLVLAAVFWGLKTNLEGYTLPFIVVVLEYLGWINFAIGVFNLFPGYPLDGGRILRALWWWKSGSLERATKVASDIGKGLALALMIVGALEIFAGVLLGGLWLIFIGMFLRTLAEGSYQQLVTAQSLQGVQAKETMVENVVTVPPELDIDRLVEDYFLRYGFQGFPVTENGEVVGVISLANIKDLPEQERNQKTVRELMTPLTEDLRIGPEASLADTLKRMTQENVGRLLVMQDGKMIGMITKSGLLRYLEFKKALQD